MTATTAGASPVNFDEFGDYGAPAKGSAPTLFSGSAGSGEFNRPRYRFQGRVTADGSSGYPAEPGRYHLYISWACPWATRTAIVRNLLGLQDTVSLSALDPIRDGRGWAFRQGEGFELDPVNSFSFLREAYEATEPGYDGHVSVPVLWDRQTGAIVSNNFPDITIDLGREFRQWANSDLDLYPAELRAEIDDLNDTVYRTVNNGVYRAGFATSQSAYETAVTELFHTLDSLEARLASRRYLFGDRLTEADVRLWVTLVRFDTVYYVHFKTNIRRITDYPNLSDYTRHLHQQKAFRSATNFDHIKRHYYTTHPQVNPTRIVPLGPHLDWDAPTSR